MFEIQIYHKPTLRVRNISWVHAEYFELAAGMYFYQNNMTLETQGERMKIYNDV